MRHLALRKSRFSIVICGSDNQHWVAYAFGEDDSGEEWSEGAESEDEEWEQDDICPGGIPFNEDPIASVDGRVIDAEKPIGDPRAYYLVVLETRIAKVLKFWRTVLRILQLGIDNIVRQECLLL